MAATPESATNTVDSSIFFGTDLARSCPSTASSPQRVSTDPASEQDRLLREYESSIGASGGRSALWTSPLPAFSPTPSPAPDAGAPRSPYRCARSGRAWRRELASFSSAWRCCSRPAACALWSPDQQPPLCFLTSETTHAANKRRAALAARLAARERQPSRSLSSSSHKSRKLLTCHACGTQSRLPPCSRVGLTRMAVS